MKTESTVHIFLKMYHTPPILIVAIAFISKLNHFID